MERNTRFDRNGVTVTTAEQTTVHQNYLESARIESTVSWEDNFGMQSVHTKYQLMEYPLLTVADNFDDKVSLDVYGDYIFMLSEEFYEASSLSADQTLKLFQDSLVLTGMPFIVGVNKKGRYYSEVNDTVHRMAQRVILEHNSSSRYDYDRFEVVDENEIILLTDTQGTLFADLVQLGLPENIAFKIMLSLSEYDKSAHHLAVFLDQGTGFQYDASNHLTMFEIYVEIAEMFGESLAQGILDLYNNSMQRMTRLWIALRRGGNAVFQEKLTADAQNLDGRASSALLAMLERGSLSDYHTGSALIRLMHTVDWDRMAIEIQDYRERMQHNGVLAKLVDNFTQVTSMTSQTIFAEAQQQISSQRASEHQGSLWSRKKENFLAIDVPLLAHIADDETLHNSIDAVHEYSAERKRKAVSPMSLLYAYMYWSSQGMEDMPMEWIESMIHDDN